MLPPDLFGQVWWLNIMWLNTANNTIVYNVPLISWSKRRGLKERNGRVRNETNSTGLPRNTVQTPLRTSLLQGRQSGQLILFGEQEKTHWVLTTFCTIERKLVHWHSARFFHHLRTISKAWLLTYIQPNGNQLILDERPEERNMLHCE